MFTALAIIDTLLVIYAIYLAFTGGAKGFAVWYSEWTNIYVRESIGYIAYAYHKLDTYNYSDNYFREM
jgi:hypothetical protein